MTTMAPHRPPPAPGFTFCPEQNELTDDYLHCKIAGEALPKATGHFIHVADVYSAEPEKLVGQFDEAPGTGKEHDQPEVYYFFSPVRYAGGRKTNARGGPGRKSRTIDGEVGKHWHSEYGAKPVKGRSAFGGYQQNFSYMVRDASTGKDMRAGWIMTEYGISPEYGGGDLVLCKIHRSPNSSATTTSSDPVVSSKKRKAATSDHIEDPTGSAWPRRTDDDDDEEQLRHVESLELNVTPVDAADQHRHTGDQFIFDQDVITEFQTKFPELFGGEPVTEEPERYGAADQQPTDQAAPPSNFFHQNIEQDFRSLYQNDAVMVGPGGGDLAVPPWAPEAQPVDAAATELIQMENYNGDGHMDASLGEEAAADEVLYGLTIRRHSNDVMMPWRPTSSMSMTFGVYYSLRP